MGQSPELATWPLGPRVTWQLHNLLAAARACVGLAKALAEAAGVELVAALAHDVVGLGQALHADGALRFGDGFRCGWLGSAGLGEGRAVVPHGLLHDALNRITWAIGVELAVILANASGRRGDLALDAVADDVIILATIRVEEFTYGGVDDLLHGLATVNHTSLDVEAAKGEHVAAAIWPGNLCINVSVGERDTYRWVFWGWSSRRLSLRCSRCRRWSLHSLWRHRASLPGAKLNGFTVGEGDRRVLTTEVAHILARETVNGHAVLFLGHRLESVGSDTVRAPLADPVNDRIASGSVVNMRRVVEVDDVTVRAVMSRKPAHSTQTAGEASRGHVLFWAVSVWELLVARGVADIESPQMLFNFGGLKRLFTKSISTEIALSV